MRSGEADLEDVVAQFEDWRAARQGRRIPGKLWRAALGLLDRYSAYRVCRSLRVSPARLKQIQGAVTVPRSRTRTSRRALTMARPGGAFVELPALGVAVGETTPSGSRLVLESATGTLTLVTRAPGDELAEAVCRLVLGAMGSGARS